MAWDLSCKDWEDRLREGRSLVPDLPLLRDQAERAVMVFNKLRLSDVTGTPTLEDAAGEWFRDIVRAVFGSYDPATGLRHIREFLCLVPKKNSKTSYGALLMLTALLLNLRPRAKFILTGPTQDTADLAFSQIRGAIDLDPVLTKKLHIREHLKKIVHRQTGAELEVMTFDPSVLTGQKAAGILVDELHESALKPKAANAIRQLRGGRVAIPEQFIVFITTQSPAPPVGVFKEELEFARKVRDGAVQGHTLPILYEFPRAMQEDREAWEDTANWPMVMPNLGRPFSVESLRADYEAEREKADANVRAWASQHLNVEIGVALGSETWAGAELWSQRTDGSLTLESLLARSDVVTMGVDGGGADDLLGLAVLGREKHTRRWMLWAMAWAHPIVLERRKAIASRLRDLSAAGDLRIVDKIGQDLDEVAEIAGQVVGSGLLWKVGFDPAGVGLIVDAMAEKGVEGDHIATVTQGYKLNGAIKTAERKLADGTLWHAAQPMMDWCVGNAKVEVKGNAILVTKQASGSAKIDPLMAAFNAVDLMSRNPAPMSGVSQVFL